MDNNADLKEEIETLSLIYNDELFDVDEQIPCSFKIKIAVCSNSGMTLVSVVSVKIPLNYPKQVPKFTIESVSGSDVQLSVLQKHVDKSLANHTNSADDIQLFQLINQYNEILADFVDSECINYISETESEESIPASILITKEAFEEWSNSFDQTLYEENVPDFTKLDVYPNNMTGKDFFSSDRIDDTEIGCDETGIPIDESLYMD
ncbi:hypothetical protein A3Q56_03488 [Intoshia linei]|uniref:RWD domain-containing protein n=1 Tax=Intoshia linei TaxID=1819745 RepID=A0A177B3C5_9BILA|nr:hypothetical protein A3Q56_03488 [Intoshia linei]